jgi:hypothetical protein
MINSRPGAAVRCVKSKLKISSTLAPAVGNRGFVVELEPVMGTKYGGSMRTYSGSLGRIAVSASLVAAVAFGGASAAFAGGVGQRPGAALAASVEKATSTQGIVRGASTAGEAVVTGGKVRVSVPETSQGTVTVAGPDGRSIGIGLPSLGSSQRAAVSQAGTVVYGASGSSAADAVQPLTDGVRVLAVESDARTKEFRFPVILPAGSFLVPEEGGAVAVEVPSGNGAVWAVGEFQSPWAKDANGRALPTSYRIEGNTLVQTVATNASTAYPVVADPKWTWGIVTGTAYFDKAETATIADHADWISVFGPLIPWPWSDLLPTWAAYIRTVAQHAHALGLCVSVKSTGTAGIYGGSTAGGYCR